MFDKRLMSIYPESEKYIAGNVVFQSMEMILNAAMIFSVTKILERLYLQTIVPKEMAAFTAVIILTIILRVFTTKAVAEMNFLASRTVKKSLREMIYMKLLKLGKAYRNKVSTSELVQESVEGVEQLETYFGLYVPQFFYALIAPIILFILFCINGSWRVGIVLLICVPLIPLAIIMVQKVAKKLLSRYWNQYTELGSSFLENLQGMTTLKIYQADRYKNEKMNEESEYFRKVTMAVLTMQLNSIIVMDFIAYGGAAIGIILAGGLFLRGEIALGSCLFMILLSAEFFLPMRKLGSYFHVAMRQE